MKEYSKDEIIKFFKSKANPALEEFGAELEESGWKIKDTQIHPPDSRWIGNTLTSKIELSKGRRLCFSYKILAAFSIRRSRVGNAHFRLLQRGGVIHPVAGHPDDMAGGLQPLDQMELVLRQYFGKDRIAIYFLGLALPDLFGPACETSIPRRAAMDCAVGSPSPVTMRTRTPRVCRS